MVPAGSTSLSPSGPFVDDPDLTDKKFPGLIPPGRIARDTYLLVVGEVTDWEPHSPERDPGDAGWAAPPLHAMQTSERIARIPSASEFVQIRAQADALAHEWTRTPEYLGCIHLMLLRGADVAVYSALSYRSDARAETRIFELPRPIEVPSSWRPRDVRLSGQITDVGAWHEGWVAVIESCVTEIGLSLETRIWIAVDADHDTLSFRVDADGPERSWQRNVRVLRARSAHRFRSRRDLGLRDRRRRYLIANRDATVPSSMCRPVWQRRYTRRLLSSGRQLGAIGDSPSIGRSHPRPLQLPPLAKPELTILHRLPEAEAVIIFGKTILLPLDGGGRNDSSHATSGGTPA